MKRWIHIKNLGLVIGFVLALIQPAMAAETPQTSTASPGPAVVAEPPAQVPQAQVPEVPLEKATAIRQAVEKLVREEIDATGSFEVDHPEAGDLLELSLTGVHQEVKHSDEGEYLIQADFKDSANGAYLVDLYVEEFGSDYELADAVVVAINGKTVEGI